MTTEQRQCDAKTVFSTNRAGTTGRPYVKKKKNLLNRHNLHKFNSKRITDLKAKHNTIKPLENSTAENLDELKYGNDFLDIPPKP